MKPSVSSHIRGQLPEFIQTEHEVFGKLLEAYYKFMEQPEMNGEHSPIGFLRTAIEQKDIDTASDVFREYIKRQVLPDLPVNELAKIDANTLIKHVKELVSVKGTLDTYKYTMQAIYDESADITQMADFVLRSSDNEYKSKTIIVIKDLPGITTENMLDIAGSSLVQQEPIAAAYIDKVSKTSLDGNDYYTCELRHDTIFGNFVPGGLVTAKFRTGGGEVIVKIDHILGDISIDDSGSLYSSGQKINLIGGTGFNGEILIDEVTKGGVDGCIVVKRGEDYAVGDNVNFVAIDGNGVDAIGEVSHIDGVDASLLPVLELDSYTITDAGDRYEVGELIELVMPGTNVNPVLKIESISTDPAVVNIISGGEYTRAQAMFIDDGVYHTTTCLVENDTVTYVPIPDVVWTTEPTLQVGGMGAYGSLVTTAGSPTIGSIYSGTLVLTNKGMNYTECPIVRFFEDAGFTQPINVANMNVEYVPTTTDELGIDAIIFKIDTINTGEDVVTTFKGIAAGTTIYFRVDCQVGSGFVGDLIMGGKIVSTSIYRRGDIDPINGEVKAYNIPTKLFGTTKNNTSAKFNAEYRLKNVLIENSGTGYNSHFTMGGFDVSDTLSTIDYPAGGLLTSKIIKVGALISGTGIPADTYVTSINSATQFSVSNPCTASNVNVNITFGGTYVTLVGGKGSGAILGATIVQNGITSITIIDGGTLYSPETTIQVFSNNGSGAVLQPVIVGGVITDITILDCGEGYNNSDLILAQDVAGTGAQLVIVTADGMIRNVRVLSGGEGYQEAGTLSISGDGINASLSPNIVNGIIVGVNVNNRGSGYTYATISSDILGDEASVSLATSPNGTIKVIDIKDGGYGYWDPTEVAPLTITVEPPTNPSLDIGGSGYVSGSTFVTIGGDGSDASGIVNVRSDGKVLSVTMTNVGSGYTYADVAISGAGIGAHGIAKIVAGAVVEIAIVGGKIAKLNPTINDSGVIEVVEIVDPGFGYTSSPNITITGGGGAAATITSATYNASRQLTGFTLTGGSGYKYGTKIVIDGDGIYAEATPVVETGITRINILDGGESYTAPKMLVYEGDNKSAKIEIIQKINEAKVMKFIGREGIGPFVVGDVLFVGVSPARAIKRGVVVKVEGTTTNPTIHYYLQDSYPLHFSAGDYIQCERSSGVHCYAGTGSNAILDAIYKDGKIVAISTIDSGEIDDYSTNLFAEIVGLNGEGAAISLSIISPSSLPKYFEGKVIKGGSGYYTKTVDPIGVWTSGDTYVIGDEIWYGEYQYVATSAGEAGATPPTHTSGISSDDVLDWEYVGYKGVLGTVMIHSNTKLPSDVKSVMVSGVIDSFKISVPGVGYINPSHIIYNNTGDAEADATINAGTIDSITLTKNGVYTLGVAPQVRVIGDGIGATATVLLAPDNSIDSIVVDTVGSGYTYAHVILYESTGRNAIMEVFADRPIKNVIVDDEGSDYNIAFISVIGDGSNSSLDARLAGTGSVTSTNVNDAGTKYTQFPSIQVRDTSAKGAISKIRIIDNGYGYTTPPLAIIEGGFDGEVISYSRSIGKVKGFNTTDFGFNYHEVPLIAFPLNVITTEMAYPFKIGELVYVEGYNYPDNDYTKGPHAYVRHIDLDRNMLELQGTTDNYNLVLAAPVGEGAGSFATNKNKTSNFEILTEHNENIVNEFSNYIGIGNVIVGERTKLKTKIMWQNRATGTISNGSVGTFKAEFVNQSGYLSNSDIVLQDSYRFHDYAYKITTGLSLKDYENTLKSLVHPSGFKMFGDIQIEGYGAVKIEEPTTDTGEQVATSSFLLLFSLFASLYIGKYINVIQYLLTLNVNNISPYIIKDVADGKINLSPYVKKLVRQRGITQTREVISMSDPSSLVFYDSTETGIIESTNKINEGSGYNPLTTTATINTSTGSGAVLAAIVSNGKVTAVKVINYGQSYADTDTINIIGEGVGAEYTINIGVLNIARVARASGSWVDDGFDDDSVLFVAGQNTMFTYTDNDHKHDDLNLWVLFNPANRSNLIASAGQTGGTYVWANDVVTITSVGHGIINNRTVLLTFISGDLVGVKGAYLVSVINADTITVNIVGSGAGTNVGAVGIDKIFNNFTPLSLMTGLNVAGVYVWSGDLITITSASHGLKHNETILMTFETGDLSTIPATLRTINYIDVNNYSIEYVGSGLGGDCMASRSYGFKKIT